MGSSTSAPTVRGRSLGIASASAIFATNSADSKFAISPWSFPISMFPCQEELCRHCTVCNDYSVRRIKSLSLSPLVQRIRLVPIEPVAPYALLRAWHFPRTETLGPVDCSGLCRYPPASGRNYPEYSSVLGISEGSRTRLGTPSYTYS